MTTEEPEQAPYPDRRRFVRTLLAGGVVATSARTAAAQDEPKAKPEDAQEPDPLQTEVDARLAIVVARHGERLDEEARESIRADIEAMVRRARRLRRVALDNGDGPFPVMIPYRDNSE